MTYEIVPMQVADVERCARLELLLFPEDDPWSEASFRSELAGTHNRYFVARTGPFPDEIVGYAGIALLGTTFQPETEIHTIGVSPRNQRVGVGAALLDRLLVVADGYGGPVFLEVRTDNVSAISLYRRSGFEIIGLRKAYYRPSGADAFTMRRTGGGRE